MKEIVILVILGLQPQDGTPVAHASGPFETAAQCEAEYEAFKAQAAQAEMPLDQFRGVCFVWDSKKASAIPTPTNILNLQTEGET